MPARSPKGKFIVLDGPDGSGKTTQIALLKNHLEQKGLKILATREPGGTPLGEEVRRILLDNSSRISAQAELMLYMACRAQLCSQVILPALQRGETVLSERFLLSSVVYQGWAGGLGPEIVKEIARLVIGGLSPDLTLILDVPPQVGAARRAKPPDRIESRGLDYQSKVREGFLREAQADPSHIRVIPASSSIEEVHKLIVEAVEDVL